MSITTKDAEDAIKGLKLIMKDIERKFGFGDQNGLREDLDHLAYAARQLSDAVYLSNKIFRN